MNILPTLTVFVGLLLVAGTLFFIAFLTVPSVLRIVCERHAQQTRCWVSIGPAGGIVGIGVGLEDGTTKVGVFLLKWQLFTIRLRRPGRRAHKMTAQTIFPKKRRTSFKEGIRWLRKAEAFREPVMKLLRSTIRAIRLRQVRCFGWFGFDDPATTGIVFGWLQGIQGLLPSKGIVIALSPDFERRRFDGAVSLVITLHIFRIGVSMIRFLVAIRS